MNSGTRVHVPVSRGVLMPEIASITEDLPVDCCPALGQCLHFKAGFVRT